MPIALTLIIASCATSPQGPTANAMTDELHCDWALKQHGSIFGFGTNFTPERRCEVREVPKIVMPKMPSGVKPAPEIAPENPIVVPTAAVRPAGP